MVRGFAGGVKPAHRECWQLCTGEATLLLRDLWFAHISAKTVGVMHRTGNSAFARVAQAQDRRLQCFERRRHRVLLAVVFPPANRAQRQGVWSFQSSKSAARASKGHRCRPHVRIDGLFAAPVYSDGCVRITVSTNDVDGNDLTRHQSSCSNFRSLRRVIPAVIDSVESGPQGKIQPKCVSQLALVAVISCCVMLALRCRCISGRANASATDLKVAIVGLEHGHVEGFLSQLPKHSDVELVGIADADTNALAEIRKEVFAARHALLQERGQHDRALPPAGRSCVHLDRRTSSCHRDCGAVRRFGDGGEAADHFAGRCASDSTRSRASTRSRCW